MPTATRTPIPGGPTPTATRTPTAGAASILLEDGDRIASGAVVTNIEDAELANNGSTAVILTVRRNSADAREVWVRSADGNLSLIFDSAAAPAGVDLDTLGRLRISPSGDFTFETGDGLDSDRLYLVTNGSVRTIAGGSPGVTPPTFRILGDVRVGEGPFVAFGGGGDRCEVTTVGEDTRTVCTNHLFVADGDSVDEVSTSDIDLSAETPTSVRPALNDAGVAFFSLRGRDKEPVLIRQTRAGQRSVILRTDTSLSGVGVLNRPQVVAANNAEDLLLSASLEAPAGSDQRPSVVGLLRGSAFTTIARDDRPYGGDTVSDLRGLGIDNDGRALLQVRIGEAADVSTLPRSLRLSDPDGTTVEVVREGLPLEDGGRQVVSFKEPRINHAGDVAFIASLGTTDSGTTVTEEVRAVLRRAGTGELLAIVSSRNTGEVGTVGGLTLAGFDDAGRLLLIGTRSRSSDRVLLLGGPPATP